MSIPCKQEKIIGKFEEFMENTKGLKATLAMISFAILLQVGTFLWLWSGQCTTLAYCVKWIEAEDTMRRAHEKTLPFRSTQEEGHSGVTR